MTDDFPGGWRKGDICYLITSRAKEKRGWTDDP